MSISTLKKITTRAKSIRKAHPGKSWKTAVKEAGREFRAGKLKLRKKRRPKKHSNRKHRARRISGGLRPNNVASVPREKIARTRARVGSHRRKPKKRRVTSPRPTRRRVGQSNGSGPSSNNWVMPVLVLGGLGLAAYALLRNQAQAPPASSSQLVQTGNAYRDSAAQKILAYAAAAGMVGDAIAKLIQALNSSSDADVNQVYDSINSGAGIPYGFIA